MSDEVNESALAVNWPIVLVCPLSVVACSETVVFKPFAVASTLAALLKALFAVVAVELIFAVRLSLVCVSSLFVLYVFDASVFDKYVLLTLVLNPFRFCSNADCFFSESALVSYVWETLVLNPSRVCSSLLARLMAVSAVDCAVSTFWFVCVSDEVNESAFCVSWPMVVVCPLMVCACS